MKQIAIVTGASGGLGKRAALEYIFNAALHFAQNEQELFLYRLQLFFLDPISGGAVSRRHHWVGFAQPCHIQSSGSPAS